MYKEKQLKELLELKMKRAAIWMMNGWSCENFSDEDKEREKELSEAIASIEASGIMCKCSECGEESESVDFKSESPDDVVCDDCWDEMREHIKDKCGLL